MSHYMRGGRGGCDDDDVDEFDEYDSTPYGGGYDQALTYGRPLPPSEEICYAPSTCSSSSIDYGRPQYSSYSQTATAYAQVQGEESFSHPKPDYGFRPGRKQQEGYPSHLEEEGGGGYGQGFQKKSDEYELYGSGGGRADHARPDSGSYQEYGRPGFEGRQEYENPGFGRRQEFGDQVRISEYEKPSQPNCGFRPDRTTQQEYPPPREEGEGVGYGFGVKEEIDEYKGYGSGAGRTEYEKPSSGGYQGYHKEDPDHGYGGRSKHEGPDYGYGGRSKNEEPGYVFGGRSKHEEPSYGEYVEEPPNPAYSGFSYVQSQEPEPPRSTYGRTSYATQSYDEPPPPIRSSYGEEEAYTGRAKYGDNSDEDEKKRGHHKHRHHHHKYAVDDE